MHLFVQQYELGNARPVRTEGNNPLQRHVQGGSLVGSEENGQRSLRDLQIPGGTVRRMGNCVIQTAAWSRMGGLWSTARRPTTSLWLGGMERTCGSSSLRKTITCGLGDSPGRRTAPSFAFLAATTDYGKCPRTDQSTITRRRLRTSTYG